MEKVIRVEAETDAVAGRGGFVIVRTDSPPPLASLAFAVLPEGSAAPPPRARQSLRGRTRPPRSSADDVEVDVGIRRTQPVSTAW